ncbi:HAD family hydrolase [Caproiciproducens sp. LBM24188]|nr:HAD family phosphatase [Oscillospiraceae bacterium]HHV32968.1 HAD family phosphatase [Clostridiales bacterium]
MTQLKGAIFDLDGTLLDSMGIWAAIDKRFLAKRGIALPDDYVEKVTPMNYADAAAYTISRFSLNETPEEVIRDWVEMSEQAYRDEIPLKPGAEQYLRHLKQSGIKLAVATAQTPRLYEPALKRNGVLELFDAFADLSEVSRGKGHPDIYLLAAKRLNLSPAECTVFEDIHAGIQGAKAGGFSTCGVYDPYSEYEQDQIIRDADRFIRSYHELWSAT